jgi:hypothetical protein
MTDSITAVLYKPPTRMTFLLKGLGHEIKLNFLDKIKTVQYFWV